MRARVTRGMRGRQSAGDALERLARLHDQGVLTDEEFAAAGSVDQRSSRCDAVGIAAPRTDRTGGLNVRVAFWLCARLGRLLLPEDG